MAYLYINPVGLIQLLAWASYQIRKIEGCACAGNDGNVFPRHWLQRKRLISDPGMYHGTCITHVPWCMSGSLISGGGDNAPGIPGACVTRNFTYLTRGPCMSACVCWCLLVVSAWWRHDMETPSALPILCKWNPPVTGQFTSRLRLQWVSNADHNFLPCCNPE